jgi:polyhydroxyalkanoate synthesis regulator phasin
MMAMDDGQRKDRERDLSGEERRMVFDLLGEFWSQAVLTAGVAEDEARRLVDRLGRIVMLQPDDIQRYRSELARRLSTQREQLERGIDGAVQQALASLRLPGKSEFAALRQRVADLSSRLDRLETTKERHSSTRRAEKV